MPDLQHAEIVEAILSGRYEDVGVPPPFTPPAVHALTAWRLRKRAGLSDPTADPHVLARSLGRRALALPGLPTSCLVDGATLFYRASTCSRAVGLAIYEGLARSILYPTVGWVEADVWELALGLSALSVVLKRCGVIEAIRVHRWLPGWVIRARSCS